MKKIVPAIVIIAIIGAAISAYIFLGPGTAFSENRKYLFVFTGKTNEEAVINSIRILKLLFFYFW